MSREQTAGGLEEGEDAIGRWLSVRVRGVEQLMRWIPPGQAFVMGSSSAEEGHYNSEAPPHQVTLTAGYWIGETPCTQALYEAVTGSSSSRFKGAQRPVESVSWREIEDFIGRLNELVPGLSSRLPTEAEWECACRAGCPEGLLGALDDIAWHRGNSELRSQPVKRKRANAWGLYDMIGNVHELCADGWRPRAYGRREARAEDPFEPAEGEFRVMRGGAWRSSARRCRAASRVKSFANGRDSLGFRLARGA